MALVECGNGHIYDDSLHQACPYCNGGGRRMEFGAGAGEAGKTVAPRSYTPSSEGMGKTVAAIRKSMEREPVAGWFVCVDGSDKGKDYRILARNNTIGRDERMDICIHGDETISRESHARVGYDEKHNVFHLIPGESANNIYLNGEPVYIPSKMTQGDVIEIGETRLVFVQFCREGYNWRDGFDTQTTCAGKDGKQDGAV